MKPILMVLVFVSASFAGCLSSEDSATSQVEAIFDFDPDKNIRTDMTIEFDGGASLPAREPTSGISTMMEPMMTLEGLQLGRIQMLEITKLLSQSQMVQTRTLKQGPSK